MLNRAVLFDFELAGQRRLLWKRVGESYEHVLLKALGFALFVAEYPALEIEASVGVRYKPDLMARTRCGENDRHIFDGERGFAFWGECGATTTRKTLWLLKHARVERLVLFKIERDVDQLAADLRRAIPVRYRPQGRLQIVNFVGRIARLTENRRIARVSPQWYTIVNV